MNILFSPGYKGTVFVKSDDDRKVMMDTIVVNLIGLLDMLELRLGIHYEDAMEDKEARYYNAVSQYMKEHPDCIMSKSFQTSGLSTSNAMLAWRDELRAAGWKFEGEKISDRLSTLIGVERYFDKGVELWDRLDEVISQIKSKKYDCSDLKIKMPVSQELQKPYVADLINTLKDHGATISMLDEAKENDSNLSKIRKHILSNEKGELAIKEQDDSVLIYKFPNEHAAYEYLAYNKMEDVDVWINADNKQMDNWLTLMGQPRTGSASEACLPHLTQLFVMGIGIFSNPLNLYTLIEWLNMPVHPIDSYFRRELTDTIAKQGGYRNEACKNIIDKYIAGDFVFLNNEQKSLPEEEQQKLRNKDKKKRAKLAEVYLPSLESGSKMETESLKIFASSLSAWARQRAHLMTERDETTLWVEQLMAVASMADSFGTLLKSVDTKAIEAETIQSWVSAIYTKASFTNAIAESGCRTVVDSPEKIISVANKTIWIGVEGNEGHLTQCSFLYPTEMEALVQNKWIQSWEAESDYCERLNLLPIFMTQKQLILVVCERRGGELTEKHPFMVRLEQMLGEKQTIAITRHPQLQIDEMESVKTVNNEGCVDSELHFNYAEKIKWPDHMSPTILGNLTEYPFDYMMEHLLDITSDEKAQLDLKTTKGNVAHAVIEALFAPRGGERVSQPGEIAKRIQSEYDETFTRIIEAKGAILQLAENKLEQKLLKEQLVECLKKLLEILTENNLSVTGCEKFVQDDMKLGLPEKLDKEGNKMERDMLGFIDMTLEDNQGRSIVFDFKWTSSKSYYEDLIKANRSVQLEMYRHLWGRETKNTVDKVAYFLMPKAHLYSKEYFKGTNCTQLETANNDNIVEQLKNSIRYRKQQIESGTLETNGEYDTLQYVKDTESRNLFPLQKDDSDKEVVVKKGNRFSQYTLFAK